MSFLVKGDVGPQNIPEGEAPRNIGGRGLFGSLAQAVMQAAGGNNSGMGLRPTGRKRSKFRMAGENFAPSLIGSRTPILFGIKKRGRGAEAVNYSPRTREKDEMESRLRRKAEGRRVRKEESKKDFKDLDIDFRIKLPKYGKDLIPPDDNRPGIRPPRDEVSIMPVPPEDQIKFDLGFPSDDRPGIRPPSRRPGIRPPKPDRDRNRGREDGRRRRPIRMSKEDYDQIKRRERKGNMQDTNHSFRIK
tara:strand:+ start:190 stop:927 length:738 start_codon:yes stop_codon:yes gene_type:complete